MSAAVKDIEDKSDASVLLPPQPIDRRGVVADGDESLMVLSNLYGISLRDTKYYCYRVTFLQKSASGTNEPILVDSESTPQYFLIQNRKTRWKLIKKVLNLYLSTFPNDQEIIFDMVERLYSLREIDFGISHKHQIYPMEIDADLCLPSRTVIVDFDGGLIEIGTHGSFRNLTNNLKAYRRVKNSTLSTLDDITSFHPATDPSCFFTHRQNEAYMLNPTKHGLTEHDLPQMEKGKRLFAGVRKNVICIEGWDGAGAVAMSLEVIHHAFWKEQCLAQTIGDYIKKPIHLVRPSQVLELRKVLRRLVCRRNYGIRQHEFLRIADVVEDCASTCTMQTRNGQFVTVAEYFRTQYGIRLQYPHLPLVLVWMRRGPNFYPVELLTVAPHQKVAKTVFDASEMQFCRSHSFLKPIKRVMETINAKNIFKLENDYCSLTQLRLNGLALMPARRFAPPDIHYRNKKSSPDEFGRWLMPRGCRFVDAKRLPVVVGAMFSSESYAIMAQVAPMAFSEFLQRFIKQCRGFGMNVGNVVQVNNVKPTMSGIRGALKTATDVGAPLVIFAQCDGDDPYLHEWIKVCERETEVLTQCIRTSTILKILDDQNDLFINNIVEKTNCKLGGVNYDVILPSDAIDVHVLFIGLYLNHPPATPTGNNSDLYSVLGYAANDCTYSSNFVGDFLLQPKYKNENIVNIHEIVNECVVRYKQSRNFIPQRIIIYRADCANGKFEHILRNEIPLIKSICDKYKIDFTIVIPSDKHLMRFFPSEICTAQRSDAQNILPGVCVDTVATSPVFCEFFLNSHCATIGTSKTTKYTVLYTTESQKKFSLNQLERWTNGLCNGYQIANQPTKWPAPYHIAANYAKRGRMIIHNLPDHNIPQPPCNLNAMKELVRNLSSRINYSSKKVLRDKRINA